MKKPENVENDKSKVELSRELTDAELDAVAGGVGDGPLPEFRGKRTGIFEGANIPDASQRYVSLRFF